MLSKHIWIINIAYTEGWKTGLVLKCIVFFPLNLSIPFWFVRYNKEEGLRMRQLEKDLIVYLENEEK